MEYTEIKTIKHLSNFLRTEVEYLDEIINGNIKIVDLTRSEHFVLDTNRTERNLIVEKFQIPKKNKKLGYRTIYKPESYILSSCLITLAENLSYIFDPNEYSHGFIKGRSIKTNADNHLHKKYILSVDIEKFFESITNEMISSSLMKLGFDKDIASMISEISTISGKLVQGYNSSPIIANIVVDDMDCELASSCDKSIVYTRYADDLYFSSNKLIPDRAKIEKIINSYGFKLNKRKTQLMCLGQNQYVTGLTVFDHKYSRISKKTKRNLRLEIYFIRKYGLDNHVLKKLKYSKEQYKYKRDIREIVDNEIYSTIYRINGWFKFINSIEPEVSTKFRRQYSEKTRNDLFDNYGIITL